MDRLFPRSFLLRVFAVCFLGTHAPLVAYLVTATSIDPRTTVVLLVSTMLGTGVAIALLRRLLAPIGVATEALQAYAGNRRILPLPKGGPDMVGRLIEAITIVRVQNEVHIRDLVDAAITDPLTELPNRRAFRSFVEEAHAAGPCSIAIVDVDHFKRVNDTLGHSEGDRALKVIADYLRAGIRSSDFVARLGGEEFAIVFPGTSPTDAAIIVDRIRGDLVEDAPFSVLGEPITFSAGISMTAANDDDLEHAIERADLLLYSAKRGGRNRIEFRAA